MAGFVYLLLNPSMPGLIKIGHTKDDPIKYRVKEISRATGVPEPFKVAFYAFVDDEELVEKKVFEELKDLRKKNREFFELSISEGIETIKSVATDFSELKYEETFYSLIDEYEPKEEKSSRGGKLSIWIEILIGVGIFIFLLDFLRTYPAWSSTFIFLIYTLIFVTRLLFIFKQKSNY